MTPNPLPAPQGQPTKKQSNVAVYIIIGVVVLFGCCGIGGILSAIAIPNFIKVQARAKQVECKTQLASYAVAQRAYRAGHDTYAANAKELEWEPMQPTRYLYLTGGQALAPTAPNAPKSDILEQVPADIRTAVGGDAEAFFAACAGNIDNDGTLDVWTVSSDPRELPGGITAPAFTPYNDVNDLLE